ncbi:MAG: acyl-CoA dehydrogenase family protein [Candidatus Dormibacteraeota bacterium]|uniref:Acyl-CoA dehydrogenase family protein n=1 Tax=Candidatus Dormiibacter inghamiae TaxID=3127013 RepID=A0A934KFB8_9BACT|nr:acyl-CoA dehydrogenase family protein [Candidatus Dormibacteraeota bacterium]MBJ7607277.1 acyl-CoA dehydrogenase family protein [Candidatus Dormibacteraeota bacterium]
MPLDFSLSPEQEEIRQLAHTFAEKEIRPVAAHYDESEEFPYEVVRKAHRLGLSPAAFLPEEYGGQGLDFLTELILNEELHWGCAGVGVCIQSMGLAIAGIRSMGNEEQKRRWLPQFTDPERLVLGGLGLTEPDSGSDALALKATARRTAERGEPGYVLSGTKQFCTNGGIADYHVIFANTNPAAGPGGIAAFLVEKDTSGLVMGRKEQKLGVRASHTAQLILADCFVPEDHRLGGEPESDAAGPGALGALTTLEATRPGVAAGALGIARAAYEFALDYACQRHQFGRPLVQHEAIGFKLADMATSIDAARLLIWRAGWMAVNRRPFERAEGSMAKLFAADVAMDVTIDAIQVLGGYGYIKEYPVEKWMRDAKIYQIWEGTAEIQRLVIARAISGQRATIRLND